LGKEGLLSGRTKQGYPYYLVGFGFQQGRFSSPLSAGSLASMKDRGKVQELGEGSEPTEHHFASPLCRKTAEKLIQAVAIDLTFHKHDYISSVLRQTLERT
jgi:glucose-6-phosphate isomerase